MSDDEELEEGKIIIKSCNLSDDYLKEISELFGNSNGRDIIMLLVDKEMYVNEISIKLGLRVSLVVYHLKKLGELGFLTITEKPISKKTKNHKFYKINLHAFAVILHKKDGESDKSILKKIFKDTVKFACVGVAGVATWFGSNIINNPDIPTTNQRIALVSSDPIFPIIITTIVIGFGLIMIYYSKKHK